MNWQRLTFLRRTSPVSTVYVVALVGTFAIFCGEQSESPASSVAATPFRETPFTQAQMPSPIGTIATDEDLGAVVTEDDLLNTSHPLEGQKAPELIGIQS